MTDLSTALRTAIASAEPKTSIRKVHERLGLSDVTYEVLRNMQAGRTTPTPEVIAGVRKILKLGPNWPDVHEESHAIASVSGVRRGQKVSLAGTPLNPIRVVGTVSAGPGGANIDYGEQLVFVPSRLSDIGGVGYVVDGDSMMPFLEPGDVAVFREHHNPRRRYPFLVKTHDGEFRVKNIGWDGKQWTLESINPAFPTEPLGTHQLLGYLIGWYRVKGSRETIDSDPNGLILAE